METKTVFTDVVKVLNLRLGDVLFMSHEFSAGSHMVSFIEVRSLSLEQDTVEVNGGDVSIGKGRTVEIIL